MKNFFALIIGLFVVFALSAQTSGTTYTLPTGVTSYTAFNKTHTGKWAAADVKDSVGGAVTKYWVFNINKSQLYYYQISLEFDTLLASGRSVGNHITVTTYGSIDGSYYTTIDSVLFHPTTMWLPAAQLVSSSPAGNTLRDVTTGVLWKYIKVAAVGTDASTCSLITKLAIKVGIRY